MRIRTVASGRYRMRVVTRGPADGPAAIVLPGLGGAGYALAPQVRALRCLGYTTHLVGPPGLGGGPALTKEDACFEALADHVGLAADALGVRRALLVGHSLGGGVALHVALRRPELVERLVLLAPAAVGSSLSWMYRLFVLPLVGRALLRPHKRGDPARLRAFGLGRFRRDDAHFVDALARWDDQSPAAARGVRAIVWGNQPHGWDRLAAIIVPGGEQKAFTLRQRLGELRDTPTLALWGSDDRVISPGDSKLLRAAHPGAEIHIARGVGHMLPLEAAAWVDAHLVRFAALPVPGSAARVA